MKGVPYMANVKRNWEIVTNEPEKTSGIYITVSNGNFFMKDLESCNMAFVHGNALIADLKYRCEVFSTMLSGFKPEAEKLFIHEEALDAIDKLIEANRLLF